MKNRLTFLLIASRTGVQRQFSINKRVFYFFICFLMLLIGGGTAGLWKANENLELAQKKHRLGNEHRQMQTIAKATRKIEHENNEIHKLLGIKDNTQPSTFEPDEN